MLAMPATISINIDCQRACDPAEFDLGIKLSWIADDNQIV